MSVALECLCTLCVSISVLCGVCQRSGPNHQQLAIKLFSPFWEVFPQFFENVGYDTRVVSPKKETSRDPLYPPRVQCVVIHYTALILDIVFVLNIVLTLHVLDLRRYKDDNYPRVAVLVRILDVDPRAGAFGLDIFLGTHRDKD